MSEKCVKNIPTSNIELFPCNMRIKRRTVIISRLLWIMSVIINFVFNAERWMLTEALTRGVLQKKVLLKISENSHENTCARVLRLKAMCCFPVNFPRFLRTPFLQNTTGRLLLMLNKERHIKKDWPFNRFMYNVEKVKTYLFFYKNFKVCLAIFQHYAWKGWFRKFRGKRGSNLNH